MNRPKKLIPALLASCIFACSFSGCAFRPPADPTPAMTISTAEIRTRMEKVAGVSSVETNINPSGFSKYAVINIYISTDNVALISAIQNYGAKLMFLNSSWISPDIISETFIWSDGDARSDGKAQAPREQVIAAVRGVKGVRVAPGLPGSAVFLDVTSKVFDGGLKASSIDLDDVPQILLKSAPVRTTKPTPPAS